MCYMKHETFKTHQRFCDLTPVKFKFHNGLKERLWDSQGIIGIIKNNLYNDTRGAFRTLSKI